MERMMSGSKNDSDVLVSINENENKSKKGSTSGGGSSTKTVSDFGNVEGMGNFLSNENSSTNELKFSKRKRSKSISRLSLQQKKDNTFEEQLAEIEYCKKLKEMDRLEEEARKQKLETEKELSSKRKIHKKNRLMSKLKKYAVQVGEEKTDQKLIEMHGYDPRELELQKKRLLGRRKRSLLGSALSESTWERLGANISLLECGHTVELASIIIETVKHLDHKMHHHIIACGPLQSLWSFILPLRSKHVQVVQPIVVLTRTLPNEEDWLRYSKFRKIFSPSCDFLFSFSVLLTQKHNNLLFLIADIYIVRGSPLNMSDLHAVGTTSASRAVLFADLESSNGSSDGINGNGSRDTSGNISDKFGNQMRDSSTILAYRALKVVNPRINVTVELISSENLRLLDESENGGGGGGLHMAGKFGQKNEQEEHSGMFDSLSELFYKTHEQHATESWLSPSFASGHAFLSTVTDTIFAQSYYNGHLIAIIQELVIGKIAFVFPFNLFLSSTYPGNFF
jgi:hypothetical protein